MKFTIDQALQQGVAAHKEGKLQDAERLYRAILQAKPNHAHANHNLGVLAVSVGKPIEAIPLFKLAVEANSRIAQFWLSYIDALLKAERLDEAKQALVDGEKYGLSSDKLDALKQRLKECVPNVTNKTAKGQTLSEKRKAQGASSSAGPSQDQLNHLLEHYQAGRLAEAEALATSLTQQFPKHPFGWKVLGAVFQQLGRLRESLAPKQKAAELSTKDAEAHSNLGNTLKELGRLEEAEASCRQAIAFKPDLAEAHSNLGNTLKELGRLNEAEASCRQAIALKADFAEAHNNLGNTLQELGKLDEAETSLRQAVVLKPDYAEAHSNLGNTLRELGRLDEAEPSHRRAIVLKPDLADAHYNLGITLQELGRLDDALVSYTQAITLKPDYAKAYSNLGVTLQELGRLDEAEAGLRQAIALKPDYAEAHYNLGNRLKEQGKLDESEACYNQAIALKPDFAEAYSNLGSTLQEFPRLDEAEACYNKAIALKPDYASAFWNLHGIQKTIQDGEYWIDKCLEADENHLEARLTKAALRFYQGDKNSFDKLMQSELKQHPYMRSFAWAFSLPNLPELYFNRFYFFDAVFKKSIISKPFYEFGVWRASSFKYLLKIFKKGYGFDTFTGLPEDWDVGNGIERAGSYSSDGIVPKIKGGEFIVGEFEDTLPVFFSENRPMASIINFDADLYSSTICALNFSKLVMDKDTILIFDELIINESWERDEFKALQEFCVINGFSYEVIAISFVTKQVAIKLIGI
jgi:tetratricopeptide (TPR) repeat protein